MDQFAAAFGRRDHALLIDCRSLGIKLISLATLDAAIVVCDTNVKHNLTSSAYNERRAECERGVELLSKRLPGIRSLRDVSVSDFQKNENALPELIRRRCRHIVTENGRTLQAAGALAIGDREHLGNVMGDSHASLRDDYEVSCRELDMMVDIALGASGVFGARMTGGGFGGCTINIVRTDAVDEFSKTIKRQYREATNIEAGVYVFSADDGAREEVKSQVCERA